MKFSLIFLLAIGSAAAQNKAACITDVSAAAGDITNAGLTIEQAITDCDEFDAACVDDIDSIVDSMDSAANHISAAVVDCGGGEETVCTTDILRVVDDVTDATTAITQAVLDCADSSKKEECANNILTATKALSQAGLDIFKATDDCKSGVSLN
ncbi:hypothetical protein TrVE_jg4784 [Triparma verrucosa]|uniref:Uncharacterized protein n=1 Tax=Triparma verrucosa TaxID=1606542 RepID=A0A9W7BGX2_9STRA|nr:hypothetical protein TrVE_jg4784 [Triparma verrucosa]